MRGFHVIVRSRRAHVANYDVLSFVRQQRVGRLLTVSSTNVPRLGLFPFVFTDTGIELHLRRDDDQTVDIVSRATCVFEVDEVLSSIPSYWEHPINGGVADQYYRCVSFECSALVELDPGAIAAHLVRLLERYQPEGRYKSVDVSDPIYTPAIEQLALLTLHPAKRQVKFRLGQQRPRRVRREIVSRLKARGTSTDLRTAALIKQMLDP